MKAIIPVVGLALFTYWCGSLVREFSALPQLTPPTPVDDLAKVPNGWVEAPQPAILIRPEVINETTPAPDNSQSTASEPKLMVTQIFAKLDRGEITVAETKSLLAANRPVPQLENSRRVPEN